MSRFFDGSPSRTARWTRRSYISRSLLCHQVGPWEGSGVEQRFWPCEMDQSREAVRPLAAGENSKDKGKEDEDIERELSLKRLRI